MTTDPTSDLIESLIDHGVKVHDMIDEFESSPGHNAIPWKKRRPEDILGPCYHHMAGEHREGRGIKHVRAIHRYHTSTDNHIVGDPVKGAGKGRGLASVVYWALILGDGSISVNQSILNITYAQGDRTTPGSENLRYVAIGFLGDLSSPGHKAGEPTFEQLRAMHTLQIVLMQYFGWKVSSARTHADFGKPACPGETVRRIVQAWRESDNSRLRADLSTWKARQEALLRLGYPLPVHGADGKYSLGGETWRALRSFQKDRGLTPDGRWGPITEGSMRDALG